MDSYLDEYHDESYDKTYQELIGFDDKKDIMDQFVKGKLNKEIAALQANNRAVRVELGYGMGIGNVKGGFGNYAKMGFANNRNLEPMIYIGKDIVVTRGTSGNEMPHIIDVTQYFEKGDNPVISLDFYGLISNTSVLLEWRKLNKNDENDNTYHTIYRSGFDIPSPRSMDYEWWDLYTAYFYAPENIDEGTYSVKIMTRSTGFGESKIPRTSNVSFIVK